MRLRFFVTRWINEIRLLVQYRQYTHQRLVALLTALSVLWVFYSIVCSLFRRGNPKVDRWCDRESLPLYLTKADPEETTLVTAFFNLGSYRNGPHAWDYSDAYSQKQWMRPFGRIANPVVAYFEDDDVADYFREIRSCLPSSKTTIVKVNRDKLWSFKMKSSFERIYSKPGYPQHHPNTVFPEHTCASHAKYELLQQSIKKNYFKTPFFAWLDITYFRNLDQTHFEIFKLVPPTTFNVEMVSMSQAYPHDPNIPAKDVIRHNLVWVSGEMVLGLADSLTNFTLLYRDTVQRLVRDEVSGGDEQIIYLMYSTKLRRGKQVMVKAYMCHEGQLGLYGYDTRFLCLGYVCRNAWTKIHKPGHN